MRLKVLIFLLIFPLSFPVFGQYFGKNKVQYTNFDWHYLQSEHFDIYFYPGAERIAEFVADVAESSYACLKEDFRYEISDRIPIIVYKSHNDFQQTNVILGTVEEGVGGFTEFFKNRVVIPYEGNYEQLRHVLHHELTHVVTLQLVYGSGLHSIITGMARLRLPLWLVEGLAEYGSLRWDNESDMFLRDATVNGYLPEIDQLSGFMAYKGGQSVLYYLAERYGNEKIGEILNKIKITRSVEKGFRQAIGIGIKDLSKRWQKYVKEQYWPEIANKKDPEDFAKKLTDHIKYQNFINNSPALSPKGDKIAFLSDKSDYFDIYLMSAFDGKILARLVKGQRTVHLEELHWLRPGITWSPDGRRIAFAAKSGAKDVLHILDVAKRKIVKTYRFDLDGAFSPSWSPTGDQIAFVGMKDGASDIFSLHLPSGEIRKITDDVFCDLEPSWSPDGKLLAFVSNRGDYIDPQDIPQNLKMQNHNYHNFDIYVINSEGSEIQRITRTNSEEKSPVWAPEGDKLAYVSDRNGIFNIFIKDLTTGEDYPITNVITGILQLSWTDNKIAFTCFYNGGYDIYLLKDPLKIKPGQIVLEDTKFEKKLQKGALVYKPMVRRRSPQGPPPPHPDVKNYVFGEEFKEGIIKLPEEEKKTAFLDTTQYKLPSGEYKIHKYKVKFSPDRIYSIAGYGPYFGLQGSTLIELSDMLGNHRISIYSNLFYDLRNSDYQVIYFYLPRRFDVGAGIFHHAFFFLTEAIDEGYIVDNIIRDRTYGLSLYLSYPLDKFRRFDLSLAWLAISRRNLYYYQYPEFDYRILVTGFDLVYDTVLWGITGPINGLRSNLMFSYSPKLNKTGLDFKTVRIDWRRYFKLKREYNLVLRLAGGVSWGGDPEKFFLGGSDNWVNYSVKGGLRIEDVRDIYFSSFETPLRGYDYYEKIGRKFFLVNTEFRFPLIRRFLLGWPLPLDFRNIRGALFWDIGSAWNENKSFRVIKRTFMGDLQLDDLLTGFGIGARVNMGGFLILRLDVAWTTDLINYSKPRYFFSLGPEF